MMRTLLVTLLLAVSLSGCASRGSFISFAGSLPEKAAVSAIAADAVSTLAGMYPPGHTVLRLLPAREAENGFALALENGLRAEGLTLASGDAPGSVVMAYVLDDLEEKAAWYLQLRLYDDKAGFRAIARAYTASGQPEAGHSRTVVEAPASAWKDFVDAAGEKAGRAYDVTREALTRQVTP